MNSAAKVPKAMQAKYEAIAQLTDAFCGLRLNDDYRKLIREAIAALCRKRPSPLERGKENIWAAVVVHAVGTLNFLFDSSQTPTCHAPEVYEFFGTATSSSQNKSKEVREMLGMSHISFKWLLPSRLDANPMVWMVQVNGLIMDIRDLPREVQEEAFRRGMIPYVPGSR